MNKTYCPLPFREAVLNNGDVLQPCCQNHSHKIYIDKSFSQSFNGDQLGKVRQQLLAGETVTGCDQCYREEAAGVESMRQRSIKKYGVVNNIEVHAIQIQFDNLCNLKCRMCSSNYSHLIYDDEIEILGKPVSFKKFITTTKIKEIDNTHLKEIKLYGGEPSISPRVQEFFKDLLSSGDISKVLISAYTNGMEAPSDSTLEAFQRCKFLDLYVSIDGFGGLNEYVRGKSNFNEIIKTLKFFQSLIKSRPSGSTFIGISTVVNLYNVNKLEDLDLFIANEFPEFGSEKKFLSYPAFLRISCLPVEYKNKIKDTIQDTEVLKFLNKNDVDYFDEFIFYNNSLDKLRKESLKDVNPELFEFIQSYKPKKSITSTDLQKFYPK